MKHNEEQQLGMNKSGTMMAPIESAKTEKGAAQYTQPTAGSSDAIGENRLFYMKDADVQVTLPISPSLKGMAKGMMDKLKSGNYGFVDKLGDRIAFERTGTRLYEALLVKYEGTEDKDNLPPLELLKQFHREEREHFIMLCEVMKQIGGDPTAVTPCANIDAVASQGWIQVMTDPRTSFEQCLHIIHLAELADTDSWEILVEMAEANGMKEFSNEFRNALAQEENHLLNVRNWMKSFAQAGMVNNSLDRSH